MFGLFQGNRILDAFALVVSGFELLHHVYKSISVG
jgi:hypothetical protein